MDSTTRFQPPHARYPHNYGSRDYNRFKFWIGIGVIWNYAALVHAVRYRLSEKNWHSVILSLFFIPFCMTVLFLALRFWHTDLARAKLSKVARIVASCSIVDAWAGMSTFAYWKAEGVWMIAFWCFVLVPAVLYFFSRQIGGGIGIR
ncbi:hypothetical protein CC86DRAFT_405073 [Ophiobolus disseminans]|uniref:Uncharacterized protein n=1 Tax=Ophiobolus disseminans TaxID=1469910 RepID=A0A6A7A429_9PLEO|nr:hypothetical protein CC86DRAFT_405073 [Ophiobolus disseminans]